MNSAMANVETEDRQAIAEVGKSVAAVAAQLDLLLREARAPVERLGATVARIGLTLTMMREDERCLQDGGTDMSAATQTAWGLRQLRRDYCCAIEDLQFHDRMAQHLGHLQDYLAGVGALLARATEGEEGASGNDARRSPKVGWSDLREQLLRCLITDAQRQLLQLFLPVPGERQRADCVGGCYSEPGSVELF